jgi:hypothetical protein
MRLGCKPPPSPPLITLLGASPRWPGARGAALGALVLAACGPGLRSVDELGEQARATGAATCSVQILGVCRNAPPASYYRGVDTWGTEQAHAGVDPLACAARAQAFFSWCGESTTVQTIFDPTGQVTTRSVDPRALSLLVRVGPPLVARGPTRLELDDMFSEIRLANGRFRGFTAGAGPATRSPATLPGTWGDRARSSSTRDAEAASRSVAAG